jgi:hypothetical protein
MKKGLLLIALALFVGSMAFGQGKTATWYYLVDGDITADGVMDDDIWSDANVTTIVPDVFFQAEVPTLTDVSVKAFWNDDNIYVGITATDDVWCPSWVTGGNDYQADKIEIYFDTNETLADGVGSHDPTTYAAHYMGHHQFAANWSETDPGTPVDAAGATFAGTYDGVDGGSYTAEYIVPWSTIPDETAATIDPFSRVQIGFDANLADNDDGAAAPTARKRLMWSNAGGIDENWNNMDDAGVITLAIPTSVKMNNVNNLKVYPTVTSDFINLPSMASSVEIFNTLGQRVQMVNNPGSQLDISALETGIHFVKVTKDNKESITKIIVE